MSLHLCSVNAQGKASFMSYSRCGKDRTFQVTICESILRGSQHCKMRIEASNTDFAEFETKI